MSGTGGDTFTLESLFTFVDGLSACDKSEDAPSDERDKSASDEALPDEAAASEPPVSHGDAATTNPIALAGETEGIDLALLSIVAQAPKALVTTSTVAAPQESAPLPAVPLAAPEPDVADQPSGVAPAPRPRPTRPAPSAQPRSRDAETPRTPAPASATSQPAAPVAPAAPPEARQKRRSATPAASPDAPPAATARARRETPRVRTTPVPAQPAATTAAKPVEKEEPRVGSPVKQTSSTGESADSRRGKHAGGPRDEKPRTQQSARSQMDSASRQTANEMRASIEERLEKMILERFAQSATATGKKLKAPTESVRRAPKAEEPKRPTSSGKPPQASVTEQPKRPSPSAEPKRAVTAEGAKPAVAAKASKPAATAQDAQQKTQPTTQKAREVHQEPSRRSALKQDAAASQAKDPAERDTRTQSANTSVGDSIMFDSPPASIEESMRMAETSHRRTFVLVASGFAAVLMVVAAIAFFVVTQMPMPEDAPQPTQNTNVEAPLDNKSDPVSPQGQPGGTPVEEERDLSGSVVYRYTSGSGEEGRPTTETVTFGRDGLCETSQIEMDMGDEAAAQKLLTELERDYGSAYREGAVEGAHVRATVDVSANKLDREEYEDELRVSVQDLVIVKKT